MTCPHCGQHNPTASRFCSACGLSLAAAAAMAPAATAKAPVAVAAALPSTQWMAPAYALVIARPGEPELVYPLTAPSLTFGRVDSCDIVCDAPSVSRHHAVLEQQPDGAYIVRDQGSTNGIYVAGQRVAEAPLRVGDPLRIPDPYGNVITLSARAIAPGQSAPQPPPDQRRAIHLDPQRDKLSIGRDPANDVAIDHPLVSRRHALIERANGALLLRDLNSTNGAFINGARVNGAQPLSMNDEIWIGPARLSLQGGLAGQIVQQASVRIDAIDLVRYTRRGGPVILNNVSLTVLPREFVAIVGGSGAGKSTLLHALSGAAPAQSGLVLFNGQDFYRAPGPYSGMIGYVPQDDILHRDLPVERALDYAALLRLPPDTTPAERAGRISAVLDDVKMEPQRHQLISKLSGGQRKRISIAVELLANPSVLFLDEPTSGLDPGLDKTMMRLLQELGDKGRTIALVTHATENINLCTLVAFVGRGGRLVYFGPPADAPAFFKVPAFSDIYSYFDQHPEEVEQQEQRFRDTSPHYHTYVLDRRISVAAPAAPPAPLTKRQLRAAAWRQWAILTARYAELLWRDRVNLALLLAQAPIVAFLLTLVASATTYTPDQLVGTQQVLLMLTLAAIWFGTINAAREIVKERPIYLRERMVNLRIWPYVLSKFAVLTGLSLVQAIILLWLVSLKTPDLPAQGIILPAPLEMYVTLALTALAGVAGGLLISSLVTSADRAMSIVPVVLIAQVIFSGGPFDLVDATKLFSLLAISRWCLGALGSTVNLNGLEGQLPAQLNGWPKEMYSAPDAWHLLAYWLVLAAFIVLLLIGTYASLRRRDTRIA